MDHVFKSQDDLSSMSGQLRMVKSPKSSCTTTAKKNTPLSIRRKISSLLGSHQADPVNRYSQNFTSMSQCGNGLYMSNTTAGKRQTLQEPKKRATTQLVSKASIIPATMPTAVQMTTLTNSSNFFDDNLRDSDSIA